MRQNEKTARRRVHAGLLWLLKIGIRKNVIKFDQTNKQCVYVSKNLILEYGTSVCGIFAKYTS